MKKSEEHKNVSGDPADNGTGTETDGMLMKKKFKSLKNIRHQGDQEVISRNSDVWNSNPSSKEDGGRLWFRLKNDNLFRKKYTLTMAYIGSFLTLGWVEGQFGPTFPELRFIVHTTLERGSLFFTMTTVGYLLGAVVMGYLFDKRILDRNLLMFLLIAGYGVTIAIIPWCSLYEFMVIIHVVKGTFGGGLDTCGNAGLVVIWGSEGDAYFSALHFAFALGAIIAPLATAPYLMPRDDSVFDTTHNRTHGFLNSTTKNHSYVSIAGDVNNQTNSNLTHTSPGNHASMVYIPYTVTMALCILTSLPFLVFFLVSLQKSLEKEKVNEIKNKGKTQRRLRIMGFITMAIYVAIYVAVVKTFSGFLTTFAMSELHWTNLQGSYITSSQWGAFATGRFLGIFFVQIFSPGRMICVFNFMMLISLLGFLIASLYDVIIGVWIFAVLAGFSMSIIFPVALMWTEQNFLRVTGKIASIFLVSASVGFLVNPPLLGTLMDTFTPMWFCYLLFAETILLCLLYFAGLYTATRIRRGKSIAAEVELTVLKEKTET